MAKAALALSSILLLALSAGPTSRQLHQMSFDQRSVAGLAVAYAEPHVATAESSPLALSDHPTKLAQSSGSVDESIPPALLVYLAVILVGSSIAVGMVRHHQRRQV